MGLIESLGEGPIALDSVIFIYWAGECPAYLSRIEPLFHAVDRGEVEIVTSNTRARGDAT